MPSLLRFRSAHATAVCGLLLLCATACGKATNNNNDSDTGTAVPDATADAEGTDDLGAGDLGSLDLGMPDTGSGAGDASNGSDADMEPQFVFAREHLEALLARIAAGQHYTADEYEELYSDAIRAALPLERMNELLDAWSVNAPYTPQTWEVDMEQEALTVVSAANGSLWRVFIRLLETPPHQIGALQFSLAHDLIPGRVLPVPNDEVYVLVHDHRGLPTTQALVEVLDPTTGTSLTPPVSTQTDVHGFARLALPPQVGQFAISVQGSDGFRTVRYSDAHAGGVEINPQLLPRTWVEEAAADAGKTLDSTKGTLFLNATWEPSTPHQLVLPVGCATISTTPSHDVDYATPWTTPPGRPDLTASQTDPIWATAWLFNVETGPFTLDVNVGSSEASFTVPSVPPDSWTTLAARFHQAEHPVHPTDATCYKPMPTIACSELPVMSAGSFERAFFAIENRRSEPVSVALAAGDGTEAVLTQIEPGEREYMANSVNSFFVVRGVTTNECLQIFQTERRAGIGIVE